MIVEHGLDPIYFEDSQVLILGSFPSVKSRELNFYYSNSQNRFWGVLGLVFDKKIGNSIDQRIAFLQEEKIALFDVVASCTITGSNDATIKDITANDLTYILASSQIKTIFTTGKKAYELYNKYIYPNNNIKAILLSSPSSANCAVSSQQLVEEYKKIRKFIN